MGRKYTNSNGNQLCSKKVITISNKSFNLKTIFGRWYYSNLFSYIEHDTIIESMMKEAILQYYEKYNLDVNAIQNDQEINEIFTYKTRLYEAATIQSLSIWGGNKGSKKAMIDKESLNLATTLRLTFGASDIIDTSNDEYDPNILNLKILSEQERKERNDKFILYEKIIKKLDDMIYKRFNKYHSSSINLYNLGRKEVESGQKEDLNIYESMLKNELDAIRELYSDDKEIIGVLERKLGLMGKYNAYMCYQESDGRIDELKEALGEFYMDAGILLQYWINDVKKIWYDLDSLSTNPLITYAICKYKKNNEINKQMLVTLLKDEPNILEKMVMPIQNKMMDSLHVIKKYDFDIRTHRGIVALIKKNAQKEKIGLLKSI